MLGDCPLPPLLHPQSLIGFTLWLSFTAHSCWSKLHPRHIILEPTMRGFSRLVPGVHKTNLSHFTHTISEATITHVASPLALYIHQLATLTSAIPLYCRTLVKVSKLIFRFQKDQTCQILFCPFYTAQLTPCMNCMLTQHPHIQLLKILCYHQCSCHHHQHRCHHWQFICPNTTMSQPVVPLMPPCGDHGVLQFGPSKLHELRCFFEELKFQFMWSHVVDEEEMNKHALQFVDCNTMDLWEILPKFADVAALYQKFVDAVYKLYPGSDMERHWLIMSPFLEQKWNSSLW